MSDSFSAWKEGAVHYLPTLVVGAVCLYFAARGYKGAWVGVVLFGCYGLFALFFFRDPSRAVSAAPLEMVAPADGVIVGIEGLEESPHYGGPCRRVSIFMSVLNVHVNRAPYEGTVREIKYRTGKFKNAMKAESSELNESNAVWMDTEHGPVTVRQISGAVARRIVCKAKVGETLARGERFGMIKLGSRTELYLPRDAEVCVKMKEKVRGGVSVVARFP